MCPLWRLEDPCAGRFGSQVYAPSDRILALIPFYRPESTTYVNNFIESASSRSSPCNSAPFKCLIDTRSEPSLQRSQPSFQVRRIQAGKQGGASKVFVCKHYCLHSITLTAGKFPCIGIGWIAGGQKYHASDEGSRCLRDLESRSVYCRPVDIPLLQYSFVNFIRLVGLNKAKYSFAIWELHLCGYMAWPECMRQVSFLSLDMILLLTAKQSLYPVDYKWLGGGVQVWLASVKYWVGWIASTRALSWSGLYDSDVHGEFSSSEPELQGQIYDAVVSPASIMATELGRRHVGIRLPWAWEKLVARGEGDAGSVNSGLKIQLSLYFETVRINIESDWEALPRIDSR